MRLPRLVLTLAACAVGTCSPSPDAAIHPADSTSELGAAVARVGGETIYASQIEAIALRDHVSARKALDRLVSYDLLTAPMSDVSNSEEPEVRAAMAQRYYEKEIAPQLRPEAMPDSVLRALYKEHIHFFVHSRLVEIGLLAIYTGERMKPAPREARRKTAQELAQALSAAPPKSLDDFKAFAEKDVWRDRKVVYQKMKQSLDFPLGPIVGKAVARLTSPGQMTGLLQSENGFFIARYIGEEPPLNKRFEEARETVRQRGFPSWKKQRFVEVMRALATAHRAEIYPTRLELKEKAP